MLKFLDLKEFSALGFLLDVI